MIRLLQGKALPNDSRSMILVTNGVGYLVYVCESLALEHDEELTLHIHTHVREDDISLYGFKTKKELNFFELLLTINGVGPKMALAISNEPIGTIENAILSNDTKPLVAISGVGKKIAERILLELKNKIEPSLEQQIYSKKATNMQPDVIYTLENLGYKRKHIESVFSQMEDPIEEAEALIRWFLQRV